MIDLTMPPREFERARNEAAIRILCEANGFFRAAEKAVSPSAALEALKFRAGLERLNRLAELLATDPPTATVLRLPARHAIPHDEPPPAA